ncbi:MAG: hypothetical protein ACI9N9_000401 [Enterobacterales bacterium]|jgi:uncharacterized protein (DUF2164 family)
MSKIKFTKQETQSMVIKLQTYFNDELDQDIGQFEAEFLLDFFAKNIGSHFYNNGLADARVIFESKLSSIDEELYAIEQVI